MKIAVPDNVSTVDVVKKAMFLAYNACGGPVGMGILQARNNVTEEDVWNNVANRGDYPGGNSFGSNKIEEKSGKVYADYVFGRMMKLSISWAENEIQVNDGKPSRDYQGWCGTYDSYELLIKVAINECVLV
jgi:hypothetical protein